MIVEFNFIRCYRFADVCVSHRHPIPTPTPHTLPLATRVCSKQELY